jgi:hypothetical protein
MGRTLRCSLAGAATGLLAGCVVVFIIGRGQPASDTVPIALFVGVFLAGPGAIAGAIIGGVAELRELSKVKAQTPREAQDRDE